MGEALMQMYSTMTETEQKELYDFALFIVSKREKTASQSHIGANATGGCGMQEDRA